MHYDAEGNLTGWTQADPEWDDRERDRMLALAAYEAEVHEICGLHDSVAKTNPDMTTVDERCPICADLERNQRMRQAEDENVEKALGDKAPPGMPRPSDGRRSFLKPVVPKSQGQGSDHADKSEEDQRHEAEGK